MRTRRTSRGAAATHRVCITVNRATRAVRVSPLATTAKNTASAPSLVRNSVASKFIVCVDQYLINICYSILHFRQVPLSRVLV